MLKVRSHDLHQLLSQTALFAHPDNDLPMINVVQLEFDGTNLVAIATDRFKLAVSRLQLRDLDHDQSLVPFKMSITLGDIRVLVDHLKTPTNQREVRQVVLDIGKGDALNIVDGLPANRLSIPITGNSTSAITFNIAPPPGVFPQWKRLMVPGDDDGTVGGIALAPRHLEPFIKVAKLRGDGHMTLRFRGPNHAAIVRIGQDFAGLIMPIRMEAATWEHPEWLTDLLGEAEETAK